MKNDYNKNITENVRDLRIDLGLGEPALFVNGNYLGQETIQKNFGEKADPINIFGLLSIAKQNYQNYQEKVSDSYKKKTPSYIV